MRNTLVGAVLAIVLVAGLFAAAHFGSRPAQGPAPQLSPSQTTAQIGPDFIGDRKIGEWILYCGEAKELPSAPSNDGHVGGNSAGTTPKEAPPPPGWKIPRCRVVMGLRNAHNPAEQVRLTFRQAGFKRVIALFLRFPPDEVANGDVVTIQLDQAKWPIPIRSCAAQFCLAIQSIKFVDLPMIEKSKHMILAFTPASTHKAVAISVPTTGLEEALTVMRRIDK
jgi:invasion protein IalB